MNTKSVIKIIIVIFIGLVAAFGPSEVFAQEEPVEETTEIPCTSGDLSGRIEISGGGATGHLEYTGDAICQGQIGIASYQKFDEVIDNQEIFDFTVVPASFAPGGQTTVTVGLPECATQIDLFVGEVLMSLDGNRYGPRLVTARHIGGTDYCEPDTPVEPPQDPPPSTHNPMARCPVTQPGNWRIQYSTDQVNWNDVPNNWVTGDLLFIGGVEGEITYYRLVDGNGNDSGNGIFVVTDGTRGTFGTMLNFNCTIQDSVLEAQAQESEACEDCPPAVCLLEVGTAVTVNNGRVLAVDSQEQPVWFDSREEAEAEGFTYAGLECSICSENWGIQEVSQTSVTVYYGPGSTREDAGRAIAYELGLDEKIFVEQYEYFVYNLGEQAMDAWYANDQPIGGGFYTIDR